MEQTNPYAAPSADVTTSELAAAPLSLAQMLFSFEGRIRRAQYWGYALVSSLIFMVLLVTASVSIRAAAGPESSQATMPVLAVLYLPFLWTTAALQVKRWHDRDKSAFWMLLGCIPLANLWAAIELGFLAGTPGRNSYGLPPA